MSTIVDLPTSGMAPTQPGRTDQRERWQPHKAGLVNVWRYADEVLTFHNGRLLLRGPNGSGKSMALELLLPFLLDANARPGRLTSAAKSRGGLYDRFMAGHGQGRRAGFMWVTFTRGDDPDGPIFVCGVRLAASSSSKGKVEPSWFTTSQRPGHDLVLLTEQRMPLTRAELSEAIGGHGVVHRTADEYRATVRATLYPTFSAQQYDAMIGTLLALRREKVSEDLDSKKLSDVLTAALPSLDDGELRQVAEGFEKLDRRRAGLEQLESDIDHVDRLARAQRQYARVAIASTAGTVRSAESQRDDVTKRERTAKATLTETGAALDEVNDELTNCQHREEELAATLSALKNSDEFRGGQRLIAAGKRRRELTADVDRLKGQVTAAEGRLQTAIRALDGAADALAAAEANRESARRDLATIAGTVGAMAVTAEAHDDQVGELLSAWSQSRREQVRRVRQTVRAHQRSVERRDEADRSRERERALLDKASNRSRQAAADHQAAVDAFAAALDEWSSVCLLLGANPDPDSDSGSGGLSAMADVPRDVEHLVHSWASDRRAGLDVRQADVDGRIHSLDEEIAAAVLQRDELVAGKVIEPIAPPWRSQRSSISDAPLWRLVDVRPGAGSAIGGVEAALEAGGLLDALVAPDGSVRLVNDEADVYLVPPADDRPSPASPGPATSLASILTAIDGGEVAAEVVEEVLAGVALVDTVEQGGSESLSGGVVGRDGTFAVAGLWGRGSVGDPRFLGAAAREQERQRHLSEVEERLADLGGQRGQLEAELRSIESDRQVVAAELASCPSGQEVLDATAAVATEGQRLVDAELRVADATAALREREDEVRSSLRVLSQLAAEHQLPTEEDALDAYESATHQFDQTAGVMVRRVSDAVSARHNHERSLGEVDDRQRAVAEVEEQSTNRRSALRGAEAEYTTLESTAGAPYAEVQRRISAAEEEDVEVRARRTTLIEQRRELDQQVGRLQADVDQAEADRERAEADRTEVHQIYRAAVADNLVADAGVDGDHDVSTLTSTLESARVLATELRSVDVDDRAFSQADGKVREALLATNQSVGGRIEITFDSGDNRWMLLRAVKDGMRRPVADIAASLRDDFGSAKVELLEEERRLFDETLTGGVRREVAKRIRQANELVDRINEQMGLVKTAAAGVQVRLKWEVHPEQPDAVRTARTLLLRGDPREQDRDALHEFFRARVEQAQVEGDPTATWEDRLRGVLDYRSWHHFSFQVAHRDWEGYLPATAARLQKLSTGERSMALHLPMLASVAAHYDGGSAEIGCPRIVLLDELFVGVDVSNRDLLFSLFATWNLDAVFTSHDEWCAYRSLDGIAIHNLHGGEADESVTTTRFVWDGHTRSIETGE